MLSKTTEIRRITETTRKQIQIDKGGDGKEDNSKATKVKAKVMKLKIQTDLSVFLFRERGRCNDKYITI